MHVRSLAIVASVSVILAGITIAAPAADLPNPLLTPGDTIAVPMEKLCQPGYTASVGADGIPVRNVPAALKHKVYLAYGLVRNHTGYCEGTEGCEVDHLISLELGGANTIKNLWPQSYDAAPWNAHVKDKLENRLHALVCQGKLPLEQAQSEIATDWIAAYKKYLGAP